ncbi:MAG: efflux RND transporter permease subunit, partial [Polyangiaceae bacterium]
MGKIFSMIPVIVCMTLLFSMIESFFVLPSHLSGKPSKPWFPRIDRGQQWVSKKLEWLIERTYRPVIEAALKYRYVAFSCGIGALVLTFGLLAGGFVPFSFFPKLEGNKVTAFARLPYGAPEEARARVRAILEKSAEETIQKLGGRQSVVGVYTRLGEGPDVRGAAQESSGNLVTIDVNLVPSEQRSFSSNAFSAAWSKTTPAIAGVEALTFNGGSGPGAGQALNVQLSHSDTRVLARASDDLSESLRGFKDLNSIQNSYAAGKPQLDFHLLPAAQTLGLTAGDVGRQLRGAFFGAEALREQRGRNEVRVMVRLPPQQRASEYDLEKLLIKTPEGGNVPLGQVASFDRNQAPTAINREDGRRIVNVTAELAPGVRSVENVITSLNKDVYPSLQQRYPGLRVESAGQQRNQEETTSALGRNLLLSLFAIYVLLAIPFRSYFQPFIVMSVIPFGFVGAVLGHLLMGYELSISSMFGLIALSGVVVNDSLVLVHATNEYRADGMTALQAMIEAGVRRFRPILLTSVTTAGGLLPMITETDRQARFLIPMAISLGFGILVATVIVLVLVPALYLILEDIRALFFGPATAKAQLRTSPAE